MIEWLIALGIGLVITMIIYSVSFAVMMTVVKRRKSEQNILLERPWMSSAVVSPVVLCLSLLAIFLLSSGMLPLWGFQLPSLLLAILLSTVGVFAAIIIVVLSEHFSTTPEKMNPPSDTGGRIKFFIIIVLLASIAEEVLFRGSSVPILTISAFILGLVAGIFMTITGSLLLPIIIHIEFNLVGFFLGIRSKSEGS